MIKFKKLHESATIPTRGSNEAAGLDLYYCGADFELLTNDFHVFSTGVACAIPEGYYGQIAPRSGLAVCHGIDTMAGVIDSDYRGELGVALINHGHRPWRVSNGMRIAQLLILPCLVAAAEWVNELPKSVRGDGGFGSTGQ